MQAKADDQIERDVPTPPFEQLAEILRARLRRGDWRPRHAIPSEKALTEAYKLSRPTVRKAIEVLVADGLLFTVKGRGTYVEDDRPDGPAQES